MSAIPEEIYEDLPHACAPKLGEVFSFSLPTSPFFSLLAWGLLTYLPFPPGLATQRITVYFRAGP